MLSQNIINCAVELLKDGALSKRAVAAKLGISRGTVFAIANGSHKSHGAAVSKCELPDQPDISMPIERCPTCRYLVFVPCLICRAREHQQMRLALQKPGGLRQ
jgi:hypothetical protein